MKPPYFNEEQRLWMSTDTLYGAKLRLILAMRHLRREIDRQIQNDVDASYRALSRLSNRLRRRG